MPSHADLHDLAEHIQSARDAGETVVGFAPNTDPTADLSTALDAFVAKYGMCGLNADWIEIGPQEAERLIVTVLAEDLAYHSRAMPADQATRLAAAFLEPFRAGGRFFTNGTFHDNTRWASWMRLTDATFDTGVVAVSAEWFGVLWVQDED